MAWQPAVDLIGPTGMSGPTGTVATYPDTSYKETTTFSYLQNNGNLFFIATGSASPGTTTPLGSIINVPNVAIKYISILYYPSGAGTIESITGIIRDFSPSNIETFAITPISGGTETNPSLFQYTFPTPITTLSPRGLQIAINVTLTSGDASVNILSIVLGFG